MSLGTPPYDRATGPEHIVDEVYRGAKRFVYLGIALLVLGLLAIAFPFATTIAAKTLIGWLLLLGAVGHFYHAWLSGKGARLVLDLIQGVVFAIVGGWLAFFPLTGIVTLTVLLAAGFVVQGVLEIAAAYRFKMLRSWRWMMISGVIALIVGVLVFAQLPSSAAWAIGLLVGVNLLSSGFGYLMIGLAAREMTKS